MENIIIRTAAFYDIDSIFKINSESLPHVSYLSKDFFHGLLGNANCFYVAEHKSVVVGFVIAFDNSLNYKSLNYIFFKKNYIGFLYIDRIAIKHQYKRYKIGTRLYNAIEQYGKLNSYILVCEVNTIPPNPVSLLFHQSIGFSGIQECRLPDGNSVLYLKKDATD